MKIDEIKLHNLKLLCKREGISTGAELGRRLGLSGNSAKSTGNQLLKGKRKIVSKTLDDLCNLFNVNESEFLIHPDTVALPQQQNQQQPTDINLLLKIIEEQNKRIEEQGMRIGEQGKRIDTVTEMVKRAQDSYEAEKTARAEEARAMWAVINEIRSHTNNSIDDIKARLNTVALSGDYKALGG